MNYKRKWPAILKPYLVLNKNGFASIDGMLTIEMTPKSKSESSDFYELGDNIVFHEPNIIGNKYWAIGQSIFPIVEISEDKKSFVCLGTGFYIHTSGIFLTAGHVLIDYLHNAVERDVADIDKVILDEGPSRIGVMVAMNTFFQEPAFEFLPLRWAQLFTQSESVILPWVKPIPKMVTDIAICQTFGSSTGALCQPLPIIQKGIKGFASLEGREVFTVGYAGMKNFSVGKDGEDGKVNFVPHVSRGQVKKRHVTNHLEKVVPSPGPCFEMEATIARGMSGSPVFDEEGIYVHALASTSWEGIDGALETQSYCTMLAPIFELKLAALNGRSINDLLAETNSGMIKLGTAGDI